MKTKMIIPAVTLLVFVVASSVQAAATATGRITEVTVYRGQALVTRTVEADVPAGTSELIVTNLPNRIISESLYAQTADSLRVLSVRYREIAVREDTREEVKQLDAQIEETNKQIYQTTRKKEHLDSQWSMFIKLREFVVAARNEDINRGLLTFEPVSKLAEFIQSKGQEYIEQTLAYEEQINEFKKQLDLLARKRQELDAGRARTEKQAVLFISARDKSKSDIKLSYLVEGANWLPQYNLRALPEKSNVVIEYNAVLNQTSGEDWTNVELNLSTAEPAMVAAAPVLEPMKIRFASPQYNQAASGTVQQQAELSQVIDQSENFRNQMRARRELAGKGKAAQEQLDVIALQNQINDFNLSSRELSRLNEQIAEIARIEGVSVAYSLEGRLTLPSRTDQQLVTIASVAAKADFTLVATPLLTDYVYLQAEVLNDSDTIFLPGPASMFRDGRFVGKSDLSIVTIGEKFTAGFGIDSQVQVTRELEDKKTQIQGGNRIDTYSYRIALNNYKNTAVQLRLLDRLPYTEDSSVKIELLKTSPELSGDAEYIRTLKKKGILRWDIELPANSLDKDAAVVTYSFAMEYDRNMQVQSQ